MNLSPGRLWLTGAALSVVLLVGSMVASATGSTVTSSQVITQPVVLASQQVPTSIPQFINQKLHWTSNETKKKVAVALEEQQKAKSVQTETESTSIQGTTKNTVKNLQTIQVAQAESSTKTSTARGSSETLTIVSHALSLQGVPYVFGGTTRSGFDCSGFTRYVYAGSGIDLPRTSYNQYTSGTKISKDELQPGDLVFFSTYSQGASHVGIFIGNGQFVHAGSEGITITSLSSSYYAPRYVGACRY